MNNDNSTIYNNDKNLSYSVFDSIPTSLSRCRCLCAVQPNKTQMTKMCFSFFRVTIVTRNFLLLKLGELFRGTYFSKAKKFVFSYCCLFLIDSISEYNKHFFFFIVGGPLAMFLNSPIKSCYQSLFTVLRLLVIWLLLPAPWQSKLNLLGQRCWDVSWSYSVKIFTRELCNLAWNDRAQSR